jgi:hypothetical protein
MSNEEGCSESSLTPEESTGKKQIIPYDIIKDLFFRISVESSQMVLDEINMMTNHEGIMFDNLIYMYVYM